MLLLFELLSHGGQHCKTEGREKGRLSERVKNTTFSSNNALFTAMAPVWCKMMVFAEVLGKWGGGCLMLRLSLGWGAFLMLHGSWSFVFGCVSSMA